MNDFQGHLLPRNIGVTLEPGTVSGTGAAGEVAIWNGTSTISGSSNVVIDNEGLLVVTTPWASQATWFINSSTGNDNNTGIDSAHAIATWTELRRRINAVGGFTVSTTITIETDLAVDDVMLTDMKAPLYPLSVTVQGVLTTVRTGSYTSAPTVRNPATNQANVITDSAVSDWTSDLGAQTGHLLIPTSGAANGIPAWVIKNLGSHQARMSSYYDALNFVEVQPSNGDTYKIVSMPFIPNWFITPYNDGLWYFQYLNMGDLTSTYFGIAQSVNGFLEFDYCVLLGFSMINGGGFFENCAIKTPMNCYYSQVILDAGYTTDINGFPSAEYEDMCDVSLLAGHIFQGVTITIINGGYARGYDVGFFDSPDTALEVRQARFRMQIVWGSGNTTWGMLISQGGAQLDAILSTCTVTGTNGDVSFVGKTYTWASLNTNKVTRSANSTSVIGPLLDSGAQTYVSIPSISTLGIIGIGDSHTNGALDTAPIAGSETLGTFGLTSPKDQQWTGTAVGSPFKANNQINSISGSSDPNLGLSTTNGTYLSWIPPLLRNSYPLSLNNIRIANLGVGGASSYTWAGENANGYVAGLLAPLDGDTIRIGSVTYTFRAVPSVANDVLIGTATGSILNLSNAVNAESTGWGAGTVVNPDVFSPNPAATTYGHFFALVPGTAGNSLTIQSSNSTRVTAVTQGLVPSTSPIAMVGGSATSALYANGITALNGGSGFGTVNIAVITLGTNDAARPGCRGRGFQNNMTTLITNLKSSFSGIKIILWKPIVNSVTATNTAITNTIDPAVVALVAADPTNVFLIDMNVLGTGSANVLILGNDGTHATPYGYQLTAQLFASKIATVLGLF